MNIKISSIQLGKIFKCLTIQTEIAKQTKKQKNTSHSEEKKKPTNQNQLKTDTDGRISR